MQGIISTDIKQLTKQKRDTGELYTRRPEAELQIGKILSLEPTETLKLLKNRQRDAADYIFDETIVYLLRKNSFDKVAVEILYRELNRRIWKLLKKFYSRFNNQSDFEDFGQRVETNLIKKIFDFASNAADYAEVNFGDYVIKTAKVVWRGELVKITHDKAIFYSEREDSNEPNNNALENKAESNDVPTDYTMMLKEGLSKLPPHTMTVAELLLDGWQIESKHENEPTISKKLGVSSRTIRNWLNDARVILADYNAEVKK